MGQIWPETGRQGADSLPNGPEGGRSTKISSRAIFGEGPVVLVLQIDKTRWASHFSTSAHLAAFGTTRHPEHERIDYALLAVHGEAPVGYVTVRELDHETVYWVYGGVFPDWRGTLLGGRVIKQTFDKQGTLARRLRFLVKSHNRAMLRVALSLGTLPVGTRLAGTELFVEFEHLFS